MCRVLVYTLLAFAATRASAQASLPSDCNAPAHEAIVQVEVDGNPFTPVPSADGCFIFVTIARPNARAAGGLAVLSRRAGAIAVLRKVALRGNPTGAVLTHDDSLLIVTTGQGIEFLDPARLKSGRGEPELGYIETGNLIGTIFANVTRDDRFLFVSAENARAIVVVDLAKARTNKYRASAIVGAIPTGNAPIALTFSVDGQYLFTTSQAAPPELNWSVACVPEGSDPNTATPNHSQGAILVVSVARAAVDPAHSVVAAIPAGCNPVRLALAPDGNTLYATVRGENQLAAFDAAKLLTDSTHAMKGRTVVGASPVGIVVVDGGKKVVVTNSNRFAANANEPQSLAVVDAQALASRGTALLGRIPAGAFPRELRVTADGRTLLVANFLSRTVEIVDLERTLAALAKP